MDQFARGGGGGVASPSLPAHVTTEVIQRLRRVGFRNDRSVDSSRSGTLVVDAVSSGVFGRDARVATGSADLMICQAAG